MTGTDTYCAGILVFWTHSIIQANRVQFYKLCSVMQLEWRNKHMKNHMKTQSCFLLLDSEVWTVADNITLTIGGQFYEI